MNNNNQNEKKYVPFASRAELIACVLLGCLNIVIFALLVEFSKIETVFLAVAASLLYLLEVAFIGLKRTQVQTAIPSKELGELLLETGSAVFKNSEAPTVIVDVNGSILWYNEAMHTITDAMGSFIGSPISELFGENVSSDIFYGEPITLFERIYSVEGTTITEEGNGLYMMALSDITSAYEIKKKYEDERVAVAYIAIDNVEDVLQYVHEKFRDAVSAVDEKIKAWADSMNAVVKSYDNDKYVMFLDSSELDKCLENRFEILDDIRDVRVGDGVSITASIGVSRIEGTLAEREAVASEAIDLALQRGGDQAVYKTADDIQYYGGRTKAVYKRSNVRSRTFTSQLTAMMARADNVIIMGHRYGDFDSFGASVGIARIAMLCGIKANIAVDLRDKNLAPCVEMMQEQDIYSQTFVDAADAVDLLSPDTLVVLVDHNTPERAQFSDIVGKVNNVVIIDHHRKADALPESVKLSYIEPSASSTCELIAEMLESAISSQNLLKEEADIILAGILLDTKQFTRNTGTRTFGAAQYLRGAGASPTDVYNLFKTDAEDLSKEARFHTAITIYRDNIAISCCDGETDETYRIIASKAADKMLTLKGVEAAFTLVRIGEQIHISGRSNGNINVQLILEAQGGGGHFDIAGAQVVSDSIITVLEKLKSGIDDYLDESDK